MTPDVNVLVAASRADHPHHTTAHAWLTSALDSTRQGQTFGLLGTVVASFLRLVTHNRVFVEPTPTSEAVGFVDALLLHPRAELWGSQDEWPHLKKLCLDMQLAANDLPDAWIAACVLQRHETLATFDRDFVRLLPANQLVLLSA